MHIANHLAQVQKNNFFQKTVLSYPCSKLDLYILKFTKVFIFIHYFTKTLQQSGNRYEGLFAPFYSSVNLDYKNK